MALPIQNFITPTSLMIKAITLPTDPRVDANGAPVAGLKTSAHIQLQAAAVDVDGVWTPVGSVKCDSVNDIESLPDDLKDLEVVVELPEIMGGEQIMTASQATMIAGAYLVAVVGAWNAQRKIV
jgi:hypothetical protein